MWSIYYFMNLFKKITLLLSFTMLLSNCSLFPIKPAGSSDSQTSSGLVANPENTAAENINSNRVEPAKPHNEKRKITLVLGGAGIASFATVGLLKRLYEEGIEVESIITTGWPTLFALANGFLKSVHDLEWFAMRLQEKDFYKASIFDPSKGYAAHERLSSLVESNFKQKEINESKVPLVISATNTEGDENDIYDRGEWRTPLLKTMSIPGIFRPYPQTDKREWIQSLQGMDVDEAKKRGGKIIVAVEMYTDYFDFLKSGKKDSSDGVFRQLYLSSLKKSMGKELKEATLIGHIQLHTSPTNFEQKRLAIFLGYKEGARLAKAIRLIEVD